MESLGEAIDAAVISRLEERAAERVTEGFDDDAAVAAALLDEFSDELADADPRHEAAAWADALAPSVTHAVAAASLRHREAQSRWPVPTDCDRLDRAFARLEANGVVARQNFTCCQSCGHAEIGAELTAHSRGYVFYHQQDTESAATGSGLFLAYGARSDGEEAALVIARTAVAALEREGLTVEWNGSSRTRIHVPLQWRKRR